MKKFLLYVPLAFIFLGLLVFIVSLVGTTTGSIPNTLELPWSQMEDFAEGKDGSLYVSLRFYERVLRYDNTGRFVRSYPMPGSGYADLATDSNGHVHLRLANSVHTYDAEWNLIGESRCDFYGDRTWILNLQGAPECAPGKGASQAPPDRSVSTGELLFSSAREFGRNRFDCVDGSSLQRNGDQLVRYSRDGSLLGNYGTRWYLWPAKFPFPLATAWILMFLIGASNSQPVRAILSRIIAGRRR